MINRDTKKYFDLLQICTVAASWYRFITFLIVLPSMSKLILTLINMVSAAVWFLLLTLIYLAIVTPIFAILFQEDSIVYVDNIAVARTLFDAMLGNYGYSVSGDEKYKHITALILHIFISNIFLLNYLIAILSTVYEVMNEQGQFAYKSFKYKYIERYQKGMENQGYSELVVHVPPINYLAILLLPAAFISQGAMDRAASVFSLIIFWLENVVYYIPMQLITELLLIPFIYLRTIFNIMRVESFCAGLGYSLIWILIGLPYLICVLLVDMFNYFKVLCDYQMDTFDDTLEKEDKLQDKIVIYNEVIDTLRAIMNIFNLKKREAFDESK